MFQIPQLYNDSRMTRNVFSLCLLLCVATISRGTDVDISAAPFVVHVLLDDYKPLCVGAIVNERTIVSAAHCFNYLGFRYKVRAGSNSPYEGGQLAAVRNVFKHPDFTKVTRGNDVAVLQLIDTLEYGKNVAPIILANPNAEIPENSKVRVYGWGQLEQKKMTETLQYSDTVAMTTEVCRASLSFVDDKMICGRLELTEDLQCVSDSGAPLTYNGVHYGITSVGYGCRGDNDDPTAFTKTAKFRDFIDFWS